MKGTNRMKASASVSMVLRNAFVVAAAVTVAVQTGSAAVKTRADFDKAFDFQQAKTWGWNPKGNGDVMVARTPDDDPETIRKRAEPIIMSAVSAELPKRGVKEAPGTPDLHV